MNFIKLSWKILLSVKIIVIPSITMSNSHGDLNSNVTGITEKQHATEMLNVSVRGLESFEKPWILLNMIQDLEINEFSKVVLKTLEFYCCQLK